MRIACTGHSSWQQKQRMHTFRSARGFPSFIEIALGGQLRKQSPQPTHFLCTFHPVSGSGFSPQASRKGYTLVTFLPVRLFSISWSWVSCLVFSGGRIVAKVPAFAPFSGIENRKRYWRSNHWGYLQTRI